MESERAWYGSFSTSNGRIGFEQVVITMYFDIQKGLEKVWGAYLVYGQRYGWYTMNFWLKKEGQMRVKKKKSDTSSNSVNITTLSFSCIIELAVLDLARNVTCLRFSSPLRRECVWNEEIYFFTLLMAQNASFQKWKISSGTWGHLACVIRGILHNKKYRYVIYSHMKHMEQVSGPYLQYWWSHWPTKLKKQFCPKKCPKRKFGESEKKNRR